MKTGYAFLILFLMLFVANGAYALGSKQFGLHDVGIYGGVGTDIGLGLGYGAKLSFLPFGVGETSLEVAAEFFMSSTTEKSTEYGNAYEETTDLMVFGILANCLFSYSKANSGLYYLFGFGIVGINVEWEERSPDDSSLGTPWGTGSMQSSEGSTAGSIVNAGFGYSFGNGLDIRLELPLIIMFAGTGDASTFAPTVTFMAGYRF